MYLALYQILYTTTTIYTHCSTERRYRIEQKSWIGCKTSLRSVGAFPIFANLVSGKQLVVEKMKETIFWTSWAITERIRGTFGR